MEEPIAPGDYDCCESGCEPCVWDVYRDEMAQWRAAQAAKNTEESPLTESSEGS